MLTACGGDPTLPDGTLAPVKVGVVTSLSGGLRSLGPGWRDAALLAEQEANAAGGVLPGRLVEMVVADDATDPSMGRAAAERLVMEEGVAAIIGAASSSVSLEVAAISGPASVPQISCCSTSPLLTTVDQDVGYFFRTVPSDELQAKVLVQIARTRFMCMRLAVMHLSDDYGTPFGAAIGQEFMGAGGTVAIDVPFADERASYAAEVGMVAAAAPDCIALVGYPESAGTIVRDYNELATPPTVTWIGTDGVRADGFITAAGDPSFVDGFYGTAPREQVGGGRDAFVARYRATFGADPVIFGASQYDAAMLILLAIAKAGSTDGEAIRTALFDVSAPNGDMTDMVVQPGLMREGIATVRSGGDVDYFGAGGDVDFDAEGNVLGDYELWQYDAASGAFQSVETIRAEDIGT